MNTNSDDAQYDQALADSLRGFKNEARPRVSFQELSRRTGIPQRSLEHALAGDRAIKARVLHNICKALGIEAGAVLARAEMLMEERSNRSDGV